MTDIINQSMKVSAFTKGAARSVALLGGLDHYATAQSARDADRKALESDWNAVGKDLQQAITTYGKVSSK